MINTIVSILKKPIIPALFDTLYMVGLSIIFSLFFGMFLAIFFYQLPVMLD